MRKRRHVLERMVTIVKLIGKHALSYRGNKNELTQSLADMSVHGNFLGILLLLSNLTAVYSNASRNVLRRAQ